MRSRAQGGLSERPEPGKAGILCVHTNHRLRSKVSCQLSSIDIYMLNVLMKVHTGAALP